MEVLIESDSRLIGFVVLIAHVEIVVAISAGADDQRHSHHRHAATIHPYVHVRSGNILTEELLGLLVD